MKPYYKDEYVTIYHGDCREVVPHLGRFDLLLTDPPYGIGFAADLTSSQRAAGMKKDSWDDEPPPIELIRECMVHADQHVIWGGNYYPLQPSRGWLVWVKPDAPRSMSSVELAWTSEDRCARSIERSISATNAERLGHPTQKPLAVISWCLSLFPEAQTILDPFAGSGTTGRAAKDLGKQAVLIEREERYCEMAARRMGQEVLAL